MHQNTQRTNIIKKSLYITLVLILLAVISLLIVSIFQVLVRGYEPAVIDSHITPTPTPIPALMATPKPVPTPEPAPDSGVLPTPEPTPEVLQTFGLADRKSRIDPTLPMVALTFDDGPGRFTNQVLDILEQHDVVATFYVIGEQVGRYKDTVLRAFEMGSEIANHTWSHRALNRISAESIYQQLKDTSDIIESVTGALPTSMRPPWGLSNANVLRISKDLNMSVLFWSLDSSDYLNRSPDRIYDSIMEEVKDKDIILLHDTYERTLETIERLIPDLIDRGFQLVTVSELMYFSDIELEPGKSYSHGR